MAKCYTHRKLTLAVLLVLLWDLSFAQTVWSGANAASNCSSGSAGTWLTPNNWCGGTLPGSASIAQFGANGSATTIGVNMNGISVANKTIGAIELSSANTAARTVNNSSGTVAGSLVLAGTTVAGTANVVLRNNCAVALTIANGSSQSFGLSLGNTTDNVILVDGTGNIVISAALKDSTGGVRHLTKAGAGTGSLTLSGTNTYSGGTTITTGTLVTGAANTLPASGVITLNGGTLRSGATTGFGQSAGALNLTDHSTITLGTGSHTLAFAAGNGPSWTAGKTLTITGWSGAYNGTAGTAGRIFVGTDASALSVAQLAQVQFRDASNNLFPASLLPSGELVAGVASQPTPASAATDYFRSQANGNWNLAATWASSPDNTNWITATLVPGTAAAGITIRNADTVTVTVSQSADDLLVEAGGMLNIAGGTLTIANGSAATDLLVHGYVKNSSALSLATGAAAGFDPGATYEHAVDGAGGTLSAASDVSWNDNSNFLVTGWGSSTSSALFSPTVTYGNVYWNSTGQSATAQLSGTLTTVAGSFRVSSTGTATNGLRLNTESLTLNISRDLVIDGGILQLSNGSLGTYVLNLGGSFNQSGGTFNPNTSSSAVTINLSGSGKTFTKSGGTLINTGINWNITGNIGLQSDLPIGSGRTLTIGGTLNADTSQLTGAGAVAVNGSLRSNHINGLSATGTLANTGSKTLGTASTVEYGASADQSVTSALTYQNLLISGSGSKSPDGNLVINGYLGLNGGYLLLGTRNAVVAGTATGSAASYVRTDNSGVLTLSGISAARTFPVGNATYNPLTLSSGDGLNWSVRVLDVVNNTAAPFNVNKAVLRTWEVTPSGAVSGATLEFQYNDGNAAQLGTAFNTGAAMQVWHYEASGWNPAGNAVTPSGNPGGVRTVTLTGWTSFSPFALANVSGPLPVHFTGIRARQRGTGITVAWTNGTEINLADYVIERSADGRQFSPLARQAPLQNTGGSVAYEYFDALPLAGDNIYRVKAVEKDGKTTYSPFVRLNLAITAPGIRLYPNPLSGSELTIQVQNLPAGDYGIALYGANGQLLRHGSYSHGGGSAAWLFPAAGLSKGWYWLQVTHGNIRLGERIFVWQG